MFRGLACWLACASAAACAPDASGLPAERQTVAGQRLWFLTVPVPGAPADDLDRLVAQPMAVTLDRDERVELIGTLSWPGACTLYIRSPVSLSSLEVVRDALERVQLPDGSSMPVFGAAGPPGQAQRGLRTPTPGRLLDGGLGVADLLITLASRPAWLAPQRPADRPRFDQAIRLQAASRPGLIDRFRRCAREAGGNAAGRLPPEETDLRLEPHRMAAYLLLGGPGSAERCRALAEREADRTCRPLAGMPDAERALLGWPLATTLRP